MEPKKPKADWEAIEGHYRAGVLSIREIAKQAGITDAAIRQKAKANNWERDLTAKVAAKVRTDLLRTELRTRTPEEKARSEKQIIDDAASPIVEVVRAHRRTITRAINIVNTLASQLREAIEAREEIVVTIHEETAGDMTVERRNRMLRAVSLGGNVSTLKDLSVATKTYVGLERQAFGLADHDDAAPPTRTDDDDRKEAKAQFDGLIEALATRAQAHKS